MIVDDQAIESAILGIFFELHLPPEGRLAYATLQKEWPGQNFRTADLDPGLIRLLQSGCLRMVDEDGERMVVLTVTGYQYGKSLGSVGGILRSNLEGLGRAFGLAKPRQQRYGLGNRRRHRATDPQGLEFARHGGTERRG
jgi:hypothetical protein